MVLKNCDPAATGGSTARKKTLCFQNRKAATGGSEARKKRLCFENRKACIMKKTKEFSVLCDVDACAIVIGPNGEVETWPENPSEFMKPINRYKDWLRNKKKMFSSDECDHYGKELLPLNDHELKWDDTFINGLPLEISVALGDQDERQRLNFHSWEDCLLDDLPVESMKELLTAVDSKLQALTERMTFLKMLYQQNNPNDKVLEETYMRSLQAPNCSLSRHGSNMSSASSGSWSEALEQSIQSLNHSCFHSESNLWFNNSAASSQSEALEESILSTNCFWSDQNQSIPLLDNGGIWFSGINEASEKSIQTTDLSGFANGLNFWPNNDLISCAIEASKSSQTPLFSGDTPEETVLDMEMPEGFLDSWGGAGYWPSESTSFSFLH